MKKFKYVICVFFLYFVGLGVINAASLDVSANKSTVVVGSTVKVTVTASGAAGWEYCLSYNSSVFSLVSANSDTGGACVKTGSTLTGYSKVTFTLKAIKSGNSNISLRDVEMYGDDGNAISANKGSVNLTARTQAEIEASYSNNAYLKKLEVEGYAITPEFSKNTEEYTLEVENDVEEVKVIAVKDQANASVSGAGTIKLTEGINKVSIVVTAQKGNKKTYVININRKELDPINVTVDGKNYTVVRKSDALEVPVFYNLSTTEIDDTEVPALISEMTDYVLVGLKDEDGNVELYTYDKGKYQIYRQLSVGNMYFVPMVPGELPDGVGNVRTIKLGEEEIEAYSTPEGRDFAYIYGMNVSSHNVGWYKIDIAEGSFQRFIEVKEDKQKNNDNLYFYLTLIFGIGFALTLLVVIILLIMYRKTKRKNDDILEYLRERKQMHQEQQNNLEVEENEEQEEKSIIQMDEEREAKSLRESRRKRKKEEQELAENIAEANMALENGSINETNDEEIETLTDTITILKDDEEQILEEVSGQKKASTKRKRKSKKEK